MVCNKACWTKYRENLKYTAHVLDRDGSESLKLLKIKVIANMLTLDIHVDI